jgi:hypothetical protein
MRFERLKTASTGYACDALVREGNADSSTRIGDDAKKGTAKKVTEVISPD